MFKSDFYGNTVAKNTKVYKDARITKNIRYKYTLSDATHYRTKTEKLCFLTKIIKKGYETLTF